MTKILIVTVPGMHGDSRPWKKLEEAFRQRDVFAGSEVKWFHYNAGIKVFSRRSLAEVARNLDASIAQEWMQNPGYDRVILAGASLGALVVRKAWLNAVDKNQGIEHTAAPWGDKVDKFVLFAGLSRGVDVDRWPRRIPVRLLELLPGRFSFEDCFRGSAFITNLRISWMRVMYRRRDLAPMTLQLLGTRDGIVGDRDSIDLDAFPDTPPIYIPDATHDNPHWIEGIKNPEGRLALIIDAFKRPPPDRSIVQSPAYDERRVLMAVHGIRASRTDDWVRQTEQIVREKWPDVVVRAPTYGYLSALRFALPQVRRRYARYFRDFYTEVVAEHRNANVSVICHSNGTYTLGQCLTQFEAIRVDRVVLAGSVLPPTYDWLALRNAKRVSEVRSDSACRDYPVAVLCSALRGLGMDDVGPGGFEGFRGDAVKEIRYHDGGHSSMLARSNLESMLEFLFNSAQQDVSLSGRETWTRRFSRAARIIAPLLVVAIAAAIVLGTLTWGWWVAAAALAVLALCFFVLDIL